MRLLCAAVRGSGQGSGIYGAIGTDFRSSLGKTRARQVHNLRNEPVRIQALEGWGQGRGGPTQGNGGTLCSCVRFRRGSEKRGSSDIFSTTTGTWRGYIKDSVKIHLMGFLANLAEEATKDSHRKP